jgi:hypothetical protein
MTADNPTAMFVTAIIGVVIARREMSSCAIAGHNADTLRFRSTAPRELEGAGGAACLDAGFHQFDPAIAPDDGDILS